MEFYTKTSYKLARDLTLRYSSSFGKSSKLFSPEIRDHIYAIYGLSRVADEIVDTYKGKDAAHVLKELEAHTFQAVKTGFSPNPLVHAFAITAKQYHIGRDLIRPFFKSMHMDLKPREYNQRLYQQYIFGSAEVIGLMCLKVFCDDKKLYKKLEPQARALGSAYQKVNFLRDMKADYEERGRVYFPDIHFDKFNDRQKSIIIKDIKKDFKKAKPAIAALPKSCRTAVAMSYAFYSELLRTLENTPAEKIKAERVRVGLHKKASVFIATRLKGGRV